MNRKRGCMLFLTLFFCLGISTSSLLAEIQRISGAENALSGLTTVHLRIQYYEDGVLKDTGQAKAQLQSDVERILSDNGISLADTSEFDRLSASRSYPIALLQLDLRMQSHPDEDRKSYLLSCQIRQPVFLSRRPVVRFLASTWESTDFGIAKDFAFVRGVARQALGRFIQEWKAQHPK